MNIPREIKRFSSPSDKPVLLWLFSKYHYQSQWNFVAKCTFKRYGNLSYQSNRVWKPTEEGMILYKHSLTV